MNNLVDNYIELREKLKEIEEQVKSYEVLILNNPEARSDERLTIVAGRKTITITDSAYEILRRVDVDVEVVETRLKKLDEFDVNIREMILNNPENYQEKIGKESIRVRSKK